MTSAESSRADARTTSPRSDSGSDAFGREHDLQPRIGVVPVEPLIPLLLCQLLVDLAERLVEDVGGDQRAGEGPLALVVQAVDEVRALFLPAGEQLVDAADVCVVQAPDESERPRPVDLPAQLRLLAGVVGAD